MFDEDTSQKALYDHVALPLVDDLLQGKNGMCMFYMSFGIVIYSTESLIIFIKK